MTVSLSPETQKLLDEKLQTGQYSSPDEVVRAALEALNELGGLDEQTLDAIDRAEEQIERGEVHDLKDVRQRILDKFVGK